jgi:hypothetical protein
VTGNSRSHLGLSSPSLVTGQFTPICNSFFAPEVDPMEAGITLVETNSMHAVLAAPGRSPDIPEENDAYGWLIGSWELDLIGYDDGGNVIHTTGEAHFACAEGRAVQDVFINPRRSDRGPESRSRTGMARRSGTIRPFRHGG